MRKISMLFCLLLVGVVFAGCASDRAMQYGTIGGVLGGGIGALSKHSTGRQILGGTAVGAAAGAVLGVIVDEARRGSVGVRSYPSPSSYPPPHQASDYGYYGIAGQKVAVRSTGYDSVRFFVEDELRRRGAVIIAVPPNSQSVGDAEFVAEVNTYQDSEAVVQIRIVRRADNVVVGSGVGRANFFYNGGDYNKVYEWASRRAVAYLR